MLETSGCYKVRPILTSNQWHQITISVIRRQPRVWPGRCLGRTSRVLLGSMECADKVEGSARACMWGVWA